MDIATEIRKAAETKLTSSEQFIVDVVVSARKGPKKVMVIVDGDSGVTIDDCAEISRELSKTLDDSAFLGDEPYLLEVSTPGVDYPLTLKRQYKKNIGRSLKVTFDDKTVEGKLENVSEENIILVQETGKGKHKETRSIEIPFSQINKAFVLVSFK